MPIQRQSESFGYFDDGPRFARDRSSTDLPKGLAALINTSGPRIQAGLLNTRTAADEDDDYDSGEGPGYPDWLRKNRERAGRYDDDGGWSEATSTSNDYLFDEMGRYRRDRFRGKESARLAVNTDGMDPDSHAYGGGAGDPLFGEFGHDGYDYEGMSRGEYDQMMRGYDPDEASARRREEIADEDDESGYNWGPVPPEHYGSRLPFDRAAARRLAGDGKCTCWDGYERVPGTEPCADDSCRKESMLLLARQEGDPPGIDSRNVRPGPLVDMPLYEQDPDDYFGRRPYSGPYCPDCGKPMPWVSGPNCRHGKRVASWLDGKPDHTDVSWEETGEGWEHPVTGCQVRPSGKYADEWEMVAPTTSKRKPYSIIDHHTDPHAMMDRHDRTTGFAPRTAAEMMQQQQQMPIAGGYLPGHQVVSLWRGQPRHGIVTALEAPNTVWVRYQDGQHLPENPGDIQLR